MNARRFFNHVFFISLFALVLFGCMDEDPTDSYDPYAQIEAEVKVIDDFLAATGASNVVKDPRGPRIVINSLGSGLSAIGTNRVEVGYSGRLFGATNTFETDTATGELRSYIAGWQVALSLLPVGSKATVYIPSPLAYGQPGKGEAIPPNSILVFDLNFIDIKETTTEMEKLKSDTVAIDTYLSQKAIAATNGGDGLRYVITAQGAGPTPGLFTKTKIKLTYRLFSNDATKVVEQVNEPTDNYFSRPADYPNGINKALRMMPEGSKATLYIPSGLAYGPYPVIDQTNNQVVPPNSNLIVDIELLDVL